MFYRGMIDFNKYCLDKLIFSFDFMGLFWKGIENNKKNIKLLLI